MIELTKPFLFSCDDLLARYQHVILICIQISHHSSNSRGFTKTALVEIKCSKNVRNNM